MKKKVVLCFMLGCMMAAFAGCGLAESEETAATVAETEQDSETENTEEDVEVEEKETFEEPAAVSDNVEETEELAENETETSYSIGSLLFELPEGWAEDADLSSDDMPVYAPEGTSSVAGCMVSVYENDLEDVQGLDLTALVDGAGEELIKEAFGENVSDYSSELCDTGLGKAAKLTCTMSDGEYSADIVMYIVVSDDSMYRLMSLDMPGAAESAQMVLDGIMATGQFRD